MKKTKLIARLIKVGANKKEAIDMVNKNFEYIERVYPMATINEKAEVIMTIQ